MQINSVKKRPLFTHRIAFKLLRLLIIIICESYVVSSPQHLTCMKFIFARNVKRICKDNIFCRIFIISNKLMNVFKLQPTIRKLPAEEQFFCALLCFV